MSKEVSPLDGLMSGLQDGGEVTGTFTLSLNDNENLQIHIQVPVFYVNDENDEVEEDVLEMTQEIPANMLKMAKMMGVF